MPGPGHNHSLFTGAGIGPGNATACDVEHVAFVSGDDTPKGGVSFDKDNGVALSVAHCRLSVERYDDDCGRKKGDGRHPAHGFIDSAGVLFERESDVSARHPEDTGERGDDKEQGDHVSLPPHERLLDAA
jgi:hypothetical protein